MRYLADVLAHDLSQKAVLLSGPRQVGKSTLAKSLMASDGEYLNWDIRADKRVIREMAWRKDASLVVLDELHKLPRWKNFLKGVIDEYGNAPPILVTGSARLEVLRKAGDALTGRTYHHRLHPIDLEESKHFLPRISTERRIQRLMETGGFPESFLHPRNAARLLNDRLDLVLREDLRDLSRTSALQAMELLIDLLRERVGAPISYANLARDLSVSAPTVKAWIGLLERLFLIFICRPFSKKLARSNRKEPKIYFYDCSAPYGDEGAVLENLVAASLLKFCHSAHDTAGHRLSLSYFRDRDGREVDFVVHSARKVIACIEVKTSDDHPHPGLRYITPRIKPLLSLQLVRHLKKATQYGAVEVRPLGSWLEQVSTNLDVSGRK